jgi:peptidoglycan/LPS O-acetylase OafA/YrhL
VKQAESTSKSTREWIPLLDAVRGLAVLGVVMTHAYGASWISDRYDQAGFSGFAKVVGTAVLWIPVLFWLSGFVIMMVMQPYFDAKRNLWSFFQRRVIRITPTWWFGIAFSICVSIVTAALHKQLPRGMSPIEWLTNLTYTPFIFKQYTEVGVGWTLFIEVQLYLMVISIVSIVRRVEKEKVHALLGNVLLVTGLAGAIFGNRFDTGIWFTSWWPWFALGSLNYLASYRRCSPWPAIILAGCMLACLQWNDLNHLTVLKAVILIAITISFHPIAGQKHFGIGKSLTFLGDLSYPYYLLHMPFVRHSNLFASMFERLHLPFWFAYPVVVMLPMAFAYIAKRMLDLIDKFLMAKLFPKKVISGR